MKPLIILLVAVSFLSPAFAQNLELHTDSQLYDTGKHLFVYGKSLPNDDVILRIFAPDNTIITFTQIRTSETGAFSEKLFVWPPASTSFPYGTYAVEAISTKQPGLSQKLDVKFLATTEAEMVPIERMINTLVFAPDTAAINTPMRIFVQTTSDGLLIGGSPERLLGTSHVHLPDGQVLDISSSIRTLHQGLYYADFTPTQVGTHVFHMVTFSQGSISHGSAATSVLGQDIGGISQQILELNEALDETASELANLKSEITGFGSTLSTASGDIDQSVDSISESVDNISNATGQLNSLLFPVVASIAVIVALQIVIIARRR